MSGTSIDGIDVALVGIDGHGLAMQVTVINTLSQRFDAQLAAELRAIAEQQATSPGAIQAANQHFSQAHCDLIRKCCADQTADLIAVHGQTILHSPPMSWQLINPALIAEQCRCDVISDLRAADLAAGGQGAPITPLADLILFGNTHQRRSIINLGGFCNMTYLPADGNPDGVQGFDLCACNHVLDYIARSCFDCAYDEDGHFAAQGTVNDACTAVLLQQLQSQRQEQRSLGTGNELFTLIDQWKNKIDRHDLAASACAALAQCIAAACLDTDIVICAGGGVKNISFMQALNQLRQCTLSDEYGVPAAYREAIAMAVLGACSADNIPITLPQVTGVTRPVRAGNWTFYTP